MMIHLYSYRGHIKLHQICSVLESIDVFPYRFQILLISPRGAIFEQSVRLEYFYTNYQVKYEAILLGL
jgi:hypothetical protein